MARTATPTAERILVAALPLFVAHGYAGASLEQSRKGTLIEGSFAVRHALWLGPAMEFARHWLRGRSRQRPTDAAADLAEGAWRGLTR
jgi:hypothetical protein